MALPLRWPLMAADSARPQGSLRGFDASRRLQGGARRKDAHDGARVAGDMGRTRDFGGGAAVDGQAANGHSHAAPLYTRAGAPIAISLACLLGLAVHRHNLLDGQATICLVSLICPALP